MIRLLVTLLAPLAVWAASFLLLPGLDDLRHYFPRGTSTDSLSVVALGLTPALSGFIVVELLAAAVPRWRALRTGGPLERAKLRRAALILTIVLAVIQAYFISRWLQQFPFAAYGVGGGVSPFMVTTTLVGGTCFVLGLAFLVDRWGLTSGFSVLLAMAAVKLLSPLPLLQNQELTSLDRLMFGTVFAGYIGATVWILRKPARVRLPACGLVPLPVAHGFLVAAGWAAAYFRFSFPGEGSAPHALLFVVLVALQAYAYGRRFTRPAARFGITGVALGDSIFYAVFMSFPWLMLLGLPLAIDAFTLATGVAVVLDIAAELRARMKEPTLVDVWAIHEVAVVGPALAALEKAGIFAHTRAVHHRALLQLFGPFVPIDVYVPAARADEAQEILAETLL